jgi:hypothetical protein
MLGVNHYTYLAAYHKYTCLATYHNCTYLAAYHSNNHNVHVLSSLSHYYWFTFRLEYHRHRVQSQHLLYRQLDVIDCFVFFTTI